MISNVDSLLIKLEKKDKIINYLRNVYKIELGEEVNIPYEYLDNCNNIYNDNNYSNNKTYESLEDKVKSLNLPDPNDKNTKLYIQKLKKLNDNTILLKHLNLSGYKFSTINKNSLKNLSDSLKLINSLEAINLSYSDINDSYSQELINIISINSIKKINLKHNLLTKYTGKKIIQYLKSCNYIQYLDVSYNPLCLDSYTCSNICLSLKSHENLYHLGLSDSSKEASFRLLFNRKYIRSLNLDENKFTFKGYEYLAKLLTDKKIQLYELSLKYSFIDVHSSHCFSKLLKFNRTLIYLNLYCSGISDIGGSIIIESLRYNESLIELNLANNKLSSLFCLNFKDLIKYNRIIKIIDISKNEGINNENFDLILEGLTNNQSIVSIGDIDTFKIWVKQKENVVKILDFNIKFQEENLIGEKDKELNNTLSKEVFLNTKNSTDNKCNVILIDRSVKEDAKNLNDANNSLNDNLNCLISFDAVPNEDQYYFFD